MHHRLFRYIAFPIFAAFALLTIVFGALVFDVIASTATAPTPSPRVVNAPSRLVIPSIGVDAPLDAVGIKADGSMDVPTDPMHAGWFSLGARPGDTGSAVIDGHVSWWYGATGVFANLSKVQRGDVVTVQHEDGTATSFVVRELRVYDAYADATDVFASDDDGAHLNLITCDGVWNRSTQQYAKRLVVFTDRVDE